MRRHRSHARGRLIFPAVDALMEYALLPFPRVGIQLGQCGICRAPATRWAVWPTGATGEAASHGASCAALEAAYT